MLHALSGLFFTFVFFIVCAVVSYAFFEPRMCSGNRKAREDSKAEVVWILNKIVLLVLFNIFGVSLYFIKRHNKYGFLLY